MAEPASIPASSARMPQPGAEMTRQKQLPWSRAFEISLKSVKIRFRRSLITALGIVFAITFLMATITRKAVTEAMAAAVPERIENERNALQSAPQIAEQIRALDEKAKNAADAVAKGDYVQAHKNLEASIKDKVLDARAAPLLEKVKELEATGTRLTDLDKLRLKMVNLGEASGGAAGAANQKQSGARDYWLIALALLVALVGIMNSMLMSVTERFREIGTMKCLGALDNFIVRLFLIESSMQGTLGTAMGIVFGLAFASLKLWWDYSDLAFNFMPWTALAQWVVLALGTGTLLAFIGAIPPAWIAARMQPVAAMRVDQ